MKKKHITLICYEPIAFDKDYKQGWSDVWIRFYQKRKRVKRGPTLISKPDLKADLQFSMEFYEENKHEEWMQHKDGDVDSKEIEDVLEILKTKSEFVDLSNDKKNGIPGIYTSKDYIDKKEAERLITEYVKLLGYESSHLKLKWKRSKFRVIPYSFRNIGQE